jgi:hypothetical protein
MQSFGISFDGSYTFLGGYVSSSQQKIHVFVNILNSSKNKINIIKINNSFFRQLIRKNSFKF